jgi:hypothetical protein
MKRLVAALIGLAAATEAPEAFAYCPSYTLSSAHNTYNCGIEAVPGENPTVTVWQGIFDTVAKGPNVWGNQGPAVANIGQGCGKPEPLQSVPAQFACELLKAIAMAESGWTQFCVPDRPADQVGGPSRTIISFDCGYGVGQVTSGMHKGESPAFDRQRVAAEPLYNMATGASILASKWRATKCVGDNQPTIVEHWYTAVWAYNGLAYVNNPNNPNYSSTRGVYNPVVGGAAPYQEKVFGRVEYPSGSPPRWQSVPLAYPDPADVGGASSPPELPEPHCASPTDCANRRAVNKSSCSGGGSGGSGGSGGTDGGTGGGDSGGSGGSAGDPSGAAGAWAGGMAGSSGGFGLPDAGVSGWGGGSDAGGGKQSQRTRVSDVDGGCACRAASNDSGSWMLPLLLALALGCRGRSRSKRRAGRSRTGWLAIAALSLSGCGSDDRASATPGSGGSVSAGGSGGSGAGGAGGGSGVGGGTAGGSGGGGVWRPFADTSPWNTPIESTASVDPDSQAMVDDLAISSQWPFLGINIKTYSIPLFWTNDSVPTVQVDSAVGGEGFPGTNGMNGTAMVPVPPGAAPDSESDHHMLLVHENRSIAWDFWDASFDGAKWSCGLCATSDLAGSGARPIAEGNPTWWTSHGSRACGFPLIAGLIRVEEMEAGEIRHALVLAYPHIRAGLYTPPASTAQATVGTEAIKSRGIPCGGRIQLDPSLNLETLGLTPSGKIIAKALQVYGAYIGDYSGAVNLYADGSPAAQSKWDAGLLDGYEVKDRIPLTAFRVLRLGTLYDNGNGG